MDYKNIREGGKKGKKVLFTMFRGISIVILFRDCVLYILFVDM